MKNIKKFAKVIALTIAGVMIMSTLASCTNSKSPAVMEYEGVKLSSNEYSYWLSTYKSMFLTNYGNNQDSPEFWAQELGDGVTIASFATGIVNENVKNNLVSIKLFDEYGLKLSNEVKDSVDASITTMRGNFPNRAAFNDTLSSLGINEKILKDIFLSQEKVKAIHEYLYGENGTEKIADEQKDKYYKEAYSRVKHILIRTKDKDKIGEDGKPVTESANGYTQTVKEELSAEEKTKKVALVDDLMARINSGEDFDKLVEEYSEDPGSKTYSDGYYVTENSGMVIEFLDAALAMKIDEVKKVESSFGVHIMKKYSLPEKAYADKANESQFADFEQYLISLAFTSKLKPLLVNVKVNEEELAQFSITTAVSSLA